MRKKFSLNGRGLLRQQGEEKVAQHKEAEACSNPSSAKSQTSLPYPSPSVITSRVALQVCNNLLSDDCL